MSHCPYHRSAAALNALCAKTEKLIDYVEEQQPDVLLLLGPFVDVKNRVVRVSIRFIRGIGQLAALHRRLRRATRWFSCL